MGAGAGAGERIIEQGKGFRQLTKDAQLNSTAVSIAKTRGDVLVCVHNSVLYPDADHGITTYFFCLYSYLIQCLQAVSPLQAFVSHWGAVDSCC